MPMISEPHANKPQTAIGIDIGGTKINAALVVTEPSGEFRQEAFERISTPTQTDAFVEALKGLVEQVIANARSYGLPTPQSIGVATAGIVNSDEGVIMGSTGNLPAIKPPFAIGPLLKEAFKLPVHVENDANAAAYGEYQLARLSRPTLKNMLMITLGTGVGTGLIIEGKLYRGAHFCAGEGGHIAIGMDNKRLCTSGRYDTWESYASGTGLAITAREIAAAHPDVNLVADLTGDLPVEELSTHRLMVALMNENPIAKEIVNLWHQHVALGLVSLLNVLDPELTIIGGGLGASIDLNHLNALLKQRLMAPPITLQVALAQLGNNAGLFGASRLALELSNMVPA
ncbi:MAG: ROK family protein [Vampirovibrionales bacterium]|nr:ROK family protein [Vampirovibrionales bacterium]